MKFHFSSLFRRSLQPIAAGTLFFLCTVVALSAQDNGVQPTGIPAKAPTRVTAARIDSLRRAATLVRDTLPVTFVLPWAPERSWLDADTLPDQTFRQVDPARKGLFDWGTLGNIGSAARPLFFQLQPRIGFDVGIHPFDLYRIAPNDLRFYRNTRTFSEVFFRQSGRQVNGQNGARLSRTFEKGLVFSLDYRSVNHLGQFQFQAARHTALAVGFWLPVGKRYDAFFTYATNTNRQQENGGITTDTVFGGEQLTGALDAPIWLSDQNALTRNYNWTVQLDQHLRLLGQNDQRALRLSHSAAFVHDLYKFADPQLAKDSIYFKNFLVDLRGIRQIITTRKLENRITLSTFRPRIFNGGERNTADLFSVGILHRLFLIDQEPVDSTVSNLFGTGELTLRLSNKFSFSAKGALGLVGSFGEYSVSADLSLGLGPAGVFRAGLLSQRYPPALVAQSLFVTKRLVWQNDFEKPVENSIWAAYALPTIGLEIQARWNVLNNYIYFDSNARPAQIKSPLQIFQIFANENFHLGPLYFENTIGLQQINNSAVLRLPEWMIKSSLYLHGKLFKKNLDLRFGGEFRLNSEFRPDGYMPIAGQFHLQDTLLQKPYPVVDPFLAAGIKSFRFVVRYENLLNALDPSLVFYTTANYPQVRPTLRFAITWRFLDANRTENNAQQGTPIPENR